MNKWTIYKRYKNNNNKLFVYWKTRISMCKCISMASERKRKKREKVSYRTSSFTTKNFMNEFDSIGEHETYT